jgi:hypothetical protein
MHSADGLFDRLEQRLDGEGLVDLNELRFIVLGIIDTLSEERAAAKWLASENERLKQVISDTEKEIAAALDAYARLSEHLPAGILK